MTHHKFTSLLLTNFNYKFNNPMQGQKVVQDRSGQVNLKIFKKKKIRYIQILLPCGNTRNSKGLRILSFTLSTEKCK